jgi:hypothetical protein
VPCIGNTRSWKTFSAIQNSLRITDRIGLNSSAALYNISNKLNHYGLRSWPVPVTKIKTVPSFIRTSLASSTLRFMDRSLQLRVLFLNILSKFISVSFVYIVFEMITQMRTVLANEKKLSLYGAGIV